MTTLFATIGAIVVVVAVVVPSALAVGLMTSMWRAWWLHPTWQLVLVPLGVPAIGFWHFVALLWFLSALKQHPLDKKTPENMKPRWEEYAQWALALILGPPIVWLMIRWVMPS